MIVTTTIRQTENFDVTFAVVTESGIKRARGTVIMGSLTGDQRSRQFIFFRFPASSDSPLNKSEYAMTTDR